MISNWLSKGAQVINSSAKSMILSAQANNNNVDTNAITKQILMKIQNKLSKQLGENIQGSFQQITNSMLRQTQLQKTLIQTKQKYNNLANQSQLQNQSIKTMVQNLLQTLKNISKCLQNDDMLAPLKQFQSAFYLCNVGKVQKQLKFFFKLYQAALEDYVKARMSIKADQHRDQMALFKNLNKSLEVELFRSRNNCADLQRRLTEIHNKNQQMNVKISIFQKLGAQNIAITQNKQKQKFIERQNQLLQKIKTLQRQKIRLQRSNKTLQSQILKINGAMSVLKSNNECMFQDMKRQHTKKQSFYQSSISKICTQKVHLQQKLKSQQQQIQQLKQQLLQQKQKQKIQKVDNKSQQIKQLNSKILQLQQNIEISNKKIQSMVSKEMMKNLFLNFQDQSKQWTVRKDIKNQIYLLLDVKVKKVQNKGDEKKWFGLF